MKHDIPLSYYYFSTIVISADQVVKKAVCNKFSFLRVVAKDLVSQMTYLILISTAFVIILSSVFNTPQHKVYYFPTLTFQRQASFNFVSCGDLIAKRIKVVLENNYLANFKLKCFNTLNVFAAFCICK